MRHERKEGFKIAASSVSGDILIPRYYDPRIGEQLDAVARSHTLSTIDELVAAGHLSHVHGSYVPRIYYGTGRIPYLRTSDLANWEVKASPKHGVAQDVFDEYGPEQDVRPEDILFVHEGTYLIGAAAMTTAFDGPVLYQHHLAKFRVLPDAPFGPYFFLAAIEAPQVHAQIRARQFSADIIDSVVGRLGQVTIPVPKDPDRLRSIEAGVREAVLGRAEIKEQLSHILREVDPYLQGKGGRRELDKVLSWRPTAASYEGQTAFLNYRPGFKAFRRRADQTVNDILLPKYYDPDVAETTALYQGRCDLVTVADLVAAGRLRMETGDEIGRLTYGTGDIPFVRTSDFGSWELKREAKQGVSRDVYDEWAVSQDAQPGDILLVRDGTYLVGTSVLLCDTDLPLLYCGGIVRLRSLDKALPPGLLFALLNLPTTRRQIRNKQFTRDIIDTLGTRLGEVVLPLPKDPGVAAMIGDTVQTHIHRRNALRVRLGKVVEAMFTNIRKATVQRLLFE